jgi:integrase
MRRKRTHAGATPFKRDGKQIGYRAQVTHPITGKKVSANKVLGLKPEIYRTATEASDICVRADETLAKLNPGGNVTVATLRERWLATGWAKESSAVTNANRTRRFCELHADLPAALLDEGHWFEFEGGTPYHLEGLKTMLNWGASTKSGRLIPRNPLADIATGSKKGNRKKNPPSIAETDQLIAAAYEAWPGYGAWIEFACYTGARPGEIDALKWSDLSADGSEIRIRRQFSATTSTFTPPKNGEERDVILSPRAKRALAKARQLSDGKPFVFVNTQGGHFRAAARTHYWETVVSWSSGRRSRRSTSRPATSRAGSCSTSCARRARTSRSRSGTRTGATWSASSTATSTRAPHASAWPTPTPSTRRPSARSASATCARSTAKAKPRPKHMREHTDPAQIRRRAKSDRCPPSKSGVRKGSHTFAGKHRNPAPRLGSRLGVWLCAEDPVAAVLPRLRHTDCTHGARSPP